MYINHFQHILQTTLYRENQQGIVTECKQKNNVVMSSISNTGNASRFQNK